MVDSAKQLNALLKRLAELERERADLIVEIKKIHADIEDAERSDSVFGANSSESGKISLFRNLFIGRDDVFPVRFESMKSGRSGYQPACRNEWKPGVCCKPKVKCAKCEHREFIPVSAEVNATPSYEDHELHDSSDG